MKRWDIAKAIYQIRIRGYLRPEWSEWFEGMTITRESNGDTILSGPVRDQAALHGLLTRVRDLGLSLVSVNQAIQQFLRRGVVHYFLSNLHPFGFAQDRLCFSSE